MIDYVEVPKEYDLNTEFPTWIIAHLKNIKEENKIWFDTIDEAIKCGCKLCKHCMPTNENC